MTDYPNFWNKILQRLGLKSFEGIENVANILTYLGYTTSASISKLRKQKELNLFQIEVSKLSTNAHFCAKHPELQSWQLGHGTIEVLKDIANAAASCVSCSVDDLESVQKKVFERCVRVAPKLIQSNVMINFDGKPSCEIICPFDFCQHVTKLSIIKQTNLFVQPNFNTYNFERHINTQHTNKKRKIDAEPCTSLGRNGDETVYSVLSCDISPSHKNAGLASINSFLSVSSSTPCRKTANNQSQLMTPKTANILTLQEKLAKANDRIHELQSVQTSTLSPLSSSPSSLNQKTPKSARIVKLSSELSVAGKETNRLREENILLRHKYSDATGKIRTFCRIKPDTSGSFYDWSISNDGLQISSEKYNLDYIIGPDCNNEKMFEMIKPLMVSGLEGYNVSIIAYGASGSGKSHTMIGSEGDFGMIPRSVDFLMNIMPDRYKVKAQFCEIYNEQLTDLLNENSNPKPAIHQTTNVAKIENLRAIGIASAAQFNKTLIKAIEGRKKSETARNPNSSRSHAVIQIEIEGKFANKENQIIHSNLLFLDLAGCENADDHLESGRSVTQTEMTNINKSVIILTSFQTVIESVKKKEKAPDFRSSKLTYLLKSSLTANTKTAIITTISQETKYLSASKASLAVARSAGQIRINNVKRNTKTL